MRNLILLLALLIAIPTFGLSVFSPSSSSGSGDTVAPATHSANYVPQWNGVANSKTLVAGFPITTQGKALVAKTSTADMVTYLGATPQTLSSLGIPNHNQLSVSATGIVTANSTFYVSSIRAKTSAGIEVLCSNGSRAALFDGGGSCSIMTESLTATVNLLTPYVKARTSAGLSLQDDGANTGLIINDGGKVGINTTGQQGQLNVSGNVYVTGNVFVDQRMYKLISVSGTAVSVTGTTNETTLATITLPANTLGANGHLHAIINASYTNNSNAKTLRFKFGGTNYLSIAPTTQQASRYNIYLHNRNATNSQWGNPAGNNTGLGPFAAAPTTSSVDTTQDVQILITGQLASASDTLTLEGYILEVFR